MVPNIVAPAGPDQDAARAARILAWRLMTGQFSTDNIDGATFYATRELVDSHQPPKWIQTFQPVTIIGRHVFFRPDKADPSS